MTTAMHTPGPWFCSGGSFDDADGIAYTIHADGMVISRANARLIAAAPDLLAACEAFVNYDSSVDHDGIDMMLAYETANLLIRAAIARAGAA
jgi:hypothetical protein